MSAAFDPPVTEALHWTLLQWKQSTTAGRCAEIASTLPRQVMMRSLPVRDYEIMTQHIKNFSQLRVEFSNQHEATKQQLVDELEETTQQIAFHQSEIAAHARQIQTHERRIERLTQRRRVVRSRQRKSADLANRIARFPVPTIDEPF